MSQSQMQEITCPKCGKKQFFRVWDSINTMEDPPLKNSLYFSTICGSPFRILLLMAMAAEKPVAY